jgi:hypothetical protein
MPLTIYDRTGFAQEVLSKPLSNKINLVLNPCNCSGIWNIPFQKDLSQYNPLPEQRYRDWFLKNEKWQVGNGQLVKLPDNVWVLNFLISSDQDSKEKLQVLYPKITKLLQDNPGMYVSYAYQPPFSDLVVDKVGFFQDLIAHSTVVTDSRGLYVFYEPF